MNGLIITSLLTLQLTGFLGGNVNNNNNNINSLINNSTKISSVCENAFNKNVTTLKINGCSKNSTNLKIQKVNGADGYCVYRTTSENGAKEYIGSTKSGNFVDKKVNGKSCSYTARAYKIINGKKVLCKLSNTVSAKKTPVAPTTKAKQTAPIVNSTNKATTTNNTTTNVPNVTTNTTKPTTNTTTKPATNTTTKAPTNTTTSTPKVTQPTAPAKESATQYDSSFASQVLKLVNQERVKGGLQELTMSQALVAPANKRAQEIKVQFSHTRPNGTQWSTVLAEYNVSVRTAGENLAYGYNTPEKVVTGWMNSPGHRANIMNPNFNKIGIGVYTDRNGTVYCTQLFSN